MIMIIMVDVHEYGSLAE